MKMGVKVLSTGQIAKLANVCPRTVSKWIDSGLLPGYRIPSSTGDGDRRVTWAAFDQFCRDNELVIERPHGAPPLNDPELMTEGLT